MICHRLNRGACPGYIDVCKAAWVRHSPGNVQGELSEMEADGSGWALGFTHVDKGWSRSREGDRSVDIFETSFKEGHWVVQRHMEGKQHLNVSRGIFSTRLLSLTTKHTHISQLIFDKTGKEWRYVQNLSVREAGAYPGMQAPNSSSRSRGDKERWTTHPCISYDMLRCSVSERWGPSESRSNRCFSLDSQVGRTYMAWLCDH